MLSGLLRSEEDRQDAVEEGAEEGMAVDSSNGGTPNGGTPAASPDGSTELGGGEARAAAQAAGARAHSLPQLCPCSAQTQKHAVTVSSGPLAPACCLALCPVMNLRYMVAERPHVD